MKERKKPSRLSYSPQSPRKSREIKATNRKRKEGDKR